ncbi:COX15/CtaA family protein [Candidatus Rhodoluna planktonica]|uniref:Cytochrome oxidase assembly protein n=1 Tax=Candidatus Rhodoluna planktonica TaxID=535712 RepID=A0A1D9DZ66_9MICO|nr:COX15/CtaA family protein [Candidatus Rhodoluna planktonica]AOY56105.1 hypothetical protein A4Z71_03805 [Candidatus Rhodoluna planktonica]
MFSAQRIRLYAWLSLASQILIVVTGGLVRLTGSGLGCPTWPKCTDDSLITVPEMGLHGAIEFGNRLLTFVLIIIALLTFITVMRLGRGNRKGLVWPSLALGLGIVAQALLGGITVLTGLNPWVVGAHFVVSGILIAIAAMLVWRVYKPSESSKSNRTGLSWLVLVVGWISVLVGIVVTGAGPHAGDAKTPRNGLDLEIWQHLHSYPGYLMLALIVLQLWLSRKELAKLSSKITAGLFVASVIQAIIGVAQARLGVPPFLVAAHMLGASVIIALLTFNLVANKSSK